jgi:putative hydrolase of the HAD superfamily
MPRAIAFDLGDTLVEYEGLPLSWEAHYPAALVNLTEAAGYRADGRQIEAACSVLRRYNTRINPRVEEIAFAVILNDLAEVFGREWPRDELALARAFFRGFRQRLRCFPDALPALAQIRVQGSKIGGFTDVPYGMPRELVMEDVGQAGLAGCFDVLLTSRDIGWRKPSIRTLQALATALGSTPSELAYVGNERKDVEVAHAFGCKSVLLARVPPGESWGQNRTISTLSELSAACSCGS